jgi:class 3 adenylate cyclase
MVYWCFSVGAEAQTTNTTRVPEIKNQSSAKALLPQEHIVINYLPVKQSAAADGLSFWWLLSLPVFTLLFLLAQKKTAQYYNRKYKALYKQKLLVKEKLLRQKNPIELNGNVSTRQTRSKKFKKVTVLFADIQGFTRIVEHMNPELLIDELDKFFFHFDAVVEKYGIEKIKTIGDAYMCAGGLPDKNRTNPVEVVLAAIEMQNYMIGMRQLRGENQYGFWELRIGIHTGPVISGVIGQKKLSFDIWGDTVNIASRMESSGVASEINITGVTHQLIKEFFLCDYRGKMPIKYKGETDMYFVKKIRPELSVNADGTTPNELFFTRLQHIRFGDLEEFVLQRMQDELPTNLFYHNVEHTMDVITRVEILGRGENVSDQDMLLLKTAALLHDSGFIFQYENHEDNSILFAEEILPKYKYSTPQIQTVINLIEITRLNATPQTELEQILKDADLDYLGRSDFVPISENLFKEMNAYGTKISLSQWNDIQYDFISKHTYYSNTARKLRQVNKDRQLQKLKELISV